MCHSKTHLDPREQAKHSEVFKGVASFNMHRRRISRWSPPEALTTTNIVVETISSYPPALENGVGPVGLSTGARNASSTIVNDGWIHRHGGFHGSQSHRSTLKQYDALVSAATSYQCGTLSVLFLAFIEYIIISLSKLPHLLLPKQVHSLVQSIGGWSPEYVVS